MTTEGKTVRDLLADIASKTKVKIIIEIDGKVSSETDI
jgi:hypothetical protein